MATKFCFHCGKPIRNDAIYCPHCGRQQNPEKPGAPRPRSHKKRTFFTIAAAILLILIVANILLPASSVDTGTADVADGGDESSTDTVSSSAVSDYSTYSNTAACFSINYPEDYSYTEPEDTSVLITESDDEHVTFQAAYVYTTADNCAVYSAEDFSDLIHADETILLNWLETPSAAVEALETDSIAGLNCCAWSVAAEIDGEAYKGEVYFVDSLGEFGCYALFWLINTDDADAGLYEEQCRAMTETFHITGNCQADSYSLYTFESCGFTFLMRDDGFEKIEEKADDEAKIYPVDGVLTDAKLWITCKDSDYYDSTAKEIEIETKYYFDYKDSTSYDTVGDEITIGRYAVSQTTLTYYNDDERYTYCLYIIDCGDTHWYVETNAAEEYVEKVSNAAGDFLFSLCVGGVEPTFPGASGSTSDTDDLSVSSDSSGDTVETDYYSVTFDSSLSGEYFCELIQPTSTNSLDACMLCVYHTASAEAAGDGYVFGIELCSGNHDFTYYNAYEIAGELTTGDIAPATYSVVLVYPTDVQFTSDTETGYRLLAAQIDDIMETFTALNGGTYTPA